MDRKVQLARVALDDASCMALNLVSWQVVAKAEGELGMKGNRDNLYLPLADLVVDF